VARPTGTSHAAVVSALGDAAVDTSGTSGNCLPDHVAVVAETELVGAVAHDCAVGGTSA